MKKVWGRTEVLAVWQCQCTDCLRTVHFKMVKRINFTLNIFHHNKKVIWINYNIWKLYKSTTSTTTRFASLLTFSLYMYTLKHTHFYTYKHGDIWGDCHSFNKHLLRASSIYSTGSGDPTSRQREQYVQMAGKLKSTGVSEQQHRVQTEVAQITVKERNRGQIWLCRLGRDEGFAGYAKLSRDPLKDFDQGSGKAWSKFWDGFLSSAVGQEREVTGSGLNSGNGWEEGQQGADGRCDLKLELTSADTLEEDTTCHGGVWMNPVFGLPWWWAGLRESRVPVTFEVSRIMLQMDLYPNVLTRDSLHFQCTTSAQKYNFNSYIVFCLIIPSQPI